VRESTWGFLVLIAQYHADSCLGFAEDSVQCACVFCCRPCCLIDFVPVLIIWFPCMQIVRHLEEAPFLHYVFDGMTKEGSPQFQQVSAGETAEWENIQNQVQAVSPDGVILVQRLGVEAAANCYGEEYAETSAAENCAKIESCPYATVPRTDVWGLVVQGRRNPKHACYILKTTRAVGCSHACTRFSLTRATCFGPSLHKQLENSWLAS
jgi:hypothetical protein